MFEVLMLSLSFQGSRDGPGAPLNPLSSGARHLPVCSFRKKEVDYLE
jgi:hypothetical protein